MLSGISPWSILLILIIVVVLFGTKKLRGMGGDLGGAVKGFKKAMSDEKPTETDSPEQIQTSQKTTTDTEKTKDTDKA